MGNPPRIGPGIHPAPISGPTVIPIIKNMMNRGMFLARPGGLLDRRGSVGGQMKAGAAAACVVRKKFHPPSVYKYRNLETGPHG